MTGLKMLFGEGFIRSGNGHYYCKACDNTDWYTEPGKCPLCNGDLAKII